MKLQHYLILLLPLALNNKLAAQDFAPPGAEWFYSSASSGAAPANAAYEHLVVVKDTSVAGYALRKIERTFYRYQGDSVKLDPYYVYQRGDTVFTYDPLLDKLCRLLVFNVQQGDTLLLDIPYHTYPLEDTTYRVVIDTVETVLYDGTPLKKYILETLDGFGWLYGFYLERVGGYEWFLPLGLFGIPEIDGPVRCYHDQQTDINFTTLDCDYRLISSTPLLPGQEVKLYPNPATAHVKIVADVPIDQLVLLDSAGRIILRTCQTEINLSPFASGVYYLRIYAGGSFVIEKVVKH